jgi:beta-aspartyl-dipeptidase (metallo-type)
MLQLLRNARVYGPEPLGVRDLLVAGGRVVWIGEGTELPAALGAATRDLGGGRLVPGFVDCHVHLTGGGGEAGHGSSVPPIALDRFTRGGVTTVIGLLGTDDAVRTPATVVAAAYALRAHGLSAWCWTGGYHLPPATITGSIRGDIALVDPVIGVGEVAISDHRSSQPTFDELARLGAEAHVGGLMTGKAGMVHLHVGDGERGLELVRRALAETELPPGTWQPTHVNRRKALFDEAAGLARHGVPVDVTAFPVGEGEDAWSAADAVRLWQERGLPEDRLTVSSDAGGCLPVFDGEGRVSAMDVANPGALAAMLRDLLVSGLPPERALPCLTSTPAALLRLPAKGRIAVGADADLLVLDDDGAVTDVMARGVWHVVDGAVRVHDPFSR